MFLSSVFFFLLSLHLFTLQETKYPYLTGTRVGFLPSYEMGRKTTLCAI